MLKFKRNSKISSCLCIIIAMTLVSIIPMTAHADIVRTIYCGSSFLIDNSASPFFCNDTPSYQTGNGGVDALNKDQILCYKFDISSLANEDIENVTLAMGIRKIYPAGTLTVKLITDGWSDSIDNDNITSTSGFTLSTDSVTKALVEKASDGDPQFTYVDVTTLVQAAKLAGKSTVQLYLTYSTGVGNGNGLRICSMVNTKHPDYRPNIIVTTKEYCPTFESDISDTKYMDNYLYVMKDRNTNAATTVGIDEIFPGKSNSTYITINSNTVDTNDPCDFYFRSDITSTVADVVSRATLNLNIVKVNRFGTLTVYKLDDDWINDTDLTAADVDDLRIDTTKYKTMVFNTAFTGEASIDITDLITAGGVTKLYFKYMSNTADNADGLRFSYSGDLRPNIKLTKTTPITNLSTGLESITGKTILQKGSAATPQSVLPILALYDTSKGTLEKVVIGTTTYLTGAITPLSLTLDLSDIVLNENHAVGFYLWDGLTEINPVGRMGSITFAQN